jgi:hypothetical protein
VQIRNAVDLFRKVIWNVLLYSGFSLGRVPKYKHLVDVFALIRPISIGIGLVRVGSQNDGSYLLPQDLEGITSVYSPGVATQHDFESYFAELGIPCFMIDGSVEGLSRSNEKFFFEKLWLSSVTEEGHSISLDDWILKTSVPGDSVLQMDIEGAEYECLLSAQTSTLNRFRVIVVEFHNLGHILNLSGLRKVQKVFEKLNETHTAIHVHANNCCPAIKVREISIPAVMEVTYIRNDRVLERNGFAEVPHELDQLNVPEYPEVEIKWRKQQ